MSEAIECGELREKAKLLRGYADGLSAPYVIPSTKELMALTMLDSAGRMERAADTILELRDDLQRVNAAVQDAEHDESMAWDRVRKAEAENAKLRELLSMYVTFARTVARGLCVQSAYADGMGRELDETEMRERAMELGIEVDE